MGSSAVSIMGPCPAISSAYDISCYITLLWDQRAQAFVGSIVHWEQSWHFAAHFTAHTAQEGNQFKMNGKWPFRTGFLVQLGSNDGALQL